MIGYSKRYQSNARAAAGGSEGQDLPGFEAPRPDHQRNFRRKIRVDVEEQVPLSLEGGNQLQVAIHAGLHLCLVLDDRGIFGPVSAEEAVQRVAEAREKFLRAVAENPMPPAIGGGTDKRHWPPPS